MEEELFDEETGEQSKSRTEHLKAWQFQPGQSGNPSGRPKGAVSLKEYAKKMLHELDEEGRMEFMKGLDKKVIWEMAEGKPEGKTDITTGGNPINTELTDEQFDRIIRTRAEKLNS